uniref:Uncharacterized protein n=1 Tax=Ciona savignyi TaxID=51511 RepID=H2YFM7_CIOSA
MKTRLRKLKIRRLKSKNSSVAVSPKTSVYQTPTVTSPPNGNNRVRNTRRLCIKILNYFEARCLQESMSSRLKIEWIYSLCLSKDR